MMPCSQNYQFDSIFLGSMLFKRPFYTVYKCYAYWNTSDDQMIAEKSWFIAGFFAARLLTTRFLTIQPLYTMKPLTSNSSSGSGVRKCVDLSTFGVTWSQIDSCETQTLTTFLTGCKKNTDRILVHTFLGLSHFPGIYFIKCRGLLGLVKKCVYWKNLRFP